MATQHRLCMTWSVIAKTDILRSLLFVFQPVHEKTNNVGFRQGPTQTDLYSHRRWVEAGNFGFRKQSNCTICVAKTKV